MATYLLSGRKSLLNLSGDLSGDQQLNGCFAVHSELRRT